MLKNVHAAGNSLQACSLYCHWVPEEDAQGSRLVAIWVNSAMRAFAEESSPEAQTPEEKVAEDQATGV